MWTTGYRDGYYYEIKYYSEGSVYGIDVGRISKMYISKNGLTVVNYDRGWDVEPEDQEAREIYESLLKRFN